MQGFNKELTSMGLLSYFKELTSKDKVRFKNFVAFKFDLSIYTINAKFRGDTNFSAAELLALQPIIEGELWRQ